MLHRQWLNYLLPLDNLTPNFFGNVDFQIQTYNLLLLAEDTYHRTKAQDPTSPHGCVLCNLPKKKKKILHIIIGKPQSHLGSISKQDNPLRLRHRHTQLTKLTLILHMSKQTYDISTYFASRKSNFTFKSTKRRASKMPNIIK